MLWHVLTGDADPVPLKTGRMPVSARIVASLDSALSIINAELPYEGLNFIADGAPVTESEFRNLADDPHGSQELVVLGTSGIERIRADRPE